MNIKEFKSELKAVYNEFSQALNNNIISRKYIRDAQQYLAILEDGGLLNPSELNTLVTSLCEVNNYTSSYYSILNLLDSNHFSLLSKMLEYSSVELDSKDYLTNHTQSLPKNRKINKSVASFVMYLVYRHRWLQKDGLSNIRPVMRKIVANLVDKSSKSTILSLVS